MCTDRLPAVGNFVSTIGRQRKWGYSITPVPYPLWTCTLSPGPISYSLNLYPTPPPPTVNRMTERRL